MFQVPVITLLALLENPVSTGTVGHTIRQVQLTEGATFPLTSSEFRVLLTAREGLIIPGGVAIFSRVQLAIAAGNLGEALKPHRRVSCVAFTLNHPAYLYTLPGTTAGNILTSCLGKHQCHWDHGFPILLFQFRQFTTFSYGGVRGQ